MASLNKVLLMGNLTRPPELRYTPSGAAVADMRLAVSRNYTTQSGEKRDETAFLTVIAWGKTAENCSEYLDKGSQILVEGRIQTRDWEGKDGQKRSATEIVRLAPGAARSLAWAALSTTTGTRPFFNELFRKMSAIDVLTTARIP